MYASHLFPSSRDVALPGYGLPSEGSILESLFAARPNETLAAGEVAFWEGDVASHVYRVSEGCLRLYRILPDGRRAIMGFVFEGEIVGISCQGTYRYTAEAVTPARLRRLDRRRLQALAAGAEHLQTFLLGRMFEEMSAAQQHIIVLGQLGAEERVAHFLMSAACRTGADQKRPVVIDLPMTRQDIADYLGLTMETVCRIVSKFKRHGLIALEGRYKVVLRRIGDLRELAGGFDDGEPSVERGMARRAAAWAH